MTSEWKHFSSRDDLQSENFLCLDWTEKGDKIKFLIILWVLSRLNEHQSDMPQI